MSWLSYLTQFILFYFLVYRLKWHHLIFYIIVGACMRWTDVLLFTLFIMNWTLYGLYISDIVLIKEGNVLFIIITYLRQPCLNQENDGFECFWLCLFFPLCLKLSSLFTMYNNRSTIDVDREGIYIERDSIKIIVFFYTSIILKESIGMDI